jgi:hypothetical protein
MKQPRRRSSSQREKQPPTPQEFWAYAREIYDDRQADWQLQLLGVPPPDWARLLGLHLQMSELERLMAGLKELP